MEKPQIVKPEVFVGDILTAKADAIVALPGVSLGGRDLSGELMKKAGLERMPECAAGRALALPAGGLDAKWLILGKAVPLGDGQNKELLPFAEAMRACLELVREKEIETAAFASFPTAEYGSRLFSVLGAVWRPIMDLKREQGLPKRTLIVCQNEEIARHYRVVYNYWYAIDKSDRLDDPGWD
ncbi:MAG: hypothetical protein Q4B42_03500 [Oscillospiraceae bacterium]|nr:hypothetical protein [Oscillospiraceae bacterium]